MTISTYLKQHICSHITHRSQQLKGANLIYQISAGLNIYTIQYRNQTSTLVLLCNGIINDTPQIYVIQYQFHSSQLTLPSNDSDPKKDSKTDLKKCLWSHHGYRQYQNHKAPGLLNLRQSLVTAIHVSCMCEMTPQVTYTACTVILGTISIKKC